MEPNYPPLGYCFEVSFDQTKEKFSFQTVSGLTVEVISESYRAGGVSFDYELPVKFKYSDLILKRGIYISPNGQEEDSIQEGFTAMMKYFELYKTDITISLLNSKGKPLMVWNIYNARPKKWSISEFNAQESKVVIETMEFKYDYFEKKST